MADKPLFSIEQIEELIKRGKERKQAKEAFKIESGGTSGSPLMGYGGIYGGMLGGMMSGMGDLSKLTMIQPPPIKQQTPPTSQRQVVPQTKRTAQVGQQIRPTQPAQSAQPVQPQPTQLQQTISDVIKNIITMLQSAQSKTTPTQPPELSAASLGKMVEPEKRELDEMFQKYLDEFKQLNELTGGMIEKMTGTSEAEMEARKASIMRQYEEQKQQIQQREQEVLEQIQEGREMLGFRSVILGKHLEQLEKEEARVSSEFAKAYSMLDMMKEEALTQALATQREEDWNRLAQILNTRLNLFNQHMNLWQTYQQNKLALRQQVLSELTTQAQIKQYEKQDALNDLEILLKPYAGTGMSYESIPLQVRRQIENLESRTNLPLTDIAKQLVSQPDVGIIRVGSNVIFYNKTTGQPLQTISTGMGGEGGGWEELFGKTQTRKMNLNQYIDSLIYSTLYGGKDPQTGEEISGWIKDRPAWFTKEGRLQLPSKLESLVEAIAMTTGLDRDDVWSRVNPDNYVDLNAIERLPDVLKEREKKAYENIKQNFQKAAHLVMMKQSQVEDVIGILGQFTSQGQSVEQIK
jgi:ElaB/YqjD/DUF883 family membrane-anchored ribosome-binding protein